MFSNSSFCSRRALLAFLASVPASLAGRGAVAAGASISVSRDPNCGCCKGWVEHLRRSGFTVHETETARVPLVRARLGVPPELASCHTAQVEGYAIEGHVPASAIERLLAERPAAIGLAVPGMPAGAPGMGADAPEPYDVILFGEEDRRTFARYLGDRPL